MRRRGWWLAAVAGGGVLVALGAKRLLDPVPPPSDLPGFALMGLGVLSLLGAVVLRAREQAVGRLGEERARAWRLAHYLLGAYAGLVAAAVVLAFKDNGADDWRAMAGPWGALEVLLHALIAPLELALGALVGYLDPEAPLYVLACVAAGLLGARLLRRRTWPRLREAGQAAGIQTGSR